MKRVLDNIASNIVKYADASREVSIGFAEDAHRVGITVRNAIASQVEEADSTGIGQTNIASLMEAMGGSCTFQEDGNSFEVTLWLARA